MARAAVPMISMLHNDFPFPISHSPFPIPHSPFPIPRSPFPVPHSPFPIPRFPFPVPHSPFPIPRSPFPVPHSPFPIPHSPFPIPHSLFRIHPSPFRLPHSAFPIPPSSFRLSHSAFPFPVVRVGRSPHDYFKPEYEQVARLFNSPSSPNSDFIYVAKVDCASDGLLCTRFDVNSYPSMFFGRPSAFSSGERHTDVGKAALEAVTPQERTAQGVLEWINVRTDRMFALPKKGGEEATVTATATAGEPGKAITTSGSGQEDEEQQQLGPRAKLHDIEEATAVAFNFIFTSLPLKKAMRNPLEDFVRLIAQHHPSHRCRNGASVLLRLLPLAWPLSAIGEEEEGKGHGSRKDLGVLRINKTALAGAKICGADLPCGLWLLFHALSVRVGPEQGGWCVNAMRDFVTVFFGCSKCRDHFLQMAQQLHMDKVKTGKDAALWVWRAHNVVNQRLEREEAESGGKRGDPAHPKRQWPTLSLCPLCAADDAMATADSETGAVDPDASWDLEYVHSFLYNFYNEPEGSGRSDAGGDTEGGGRGGGGKAEMVERRGGGGMMMLRSKQKWGGSSYGSHQV
ncbi:unnamed protein product [Closterium sp. NIES-64]|nr:unnamed protein product [Closterium sp. NIES-64]